MFTNAAWDSYEKLKQIFVELMDAMLKYQDETCLLKLFCYTFALLIEEIYKEVQKNETIF